MSKSYRLINDFGEIVRMTERNYLRYLKANASGEGRSASDFGKLIGTLSWTATDCDREDFQNMYDSLKAAQDLK